MSILIAVWQLGPDFLINRLDWFNALRWHVTPNESRVGDKRLEVPVRLAPMNPASVPFL